MPVNVAEEIGDFGHSADMLDDDVKSTRFIASCLWIAIVEAFRDLVHHLQWSWSSWSWVPGSNSAAASTNTTPADLPAEVGTESSEAPEQFRMAL